jgi:hypothetical protein
MSIKSKTCRACGVEKPLSEYYANKGMADGHLNYCKECKRADSVRRRRDNLERIRKYDRARGSLNPPEYRARYRAEYPQKYKAQTAVSNAVRDGRLAKPDQCEECDSTFRVEGHHDDYSKPLEVRWLCSVCHKKWHLENGEGINGRAA